MYGGTLKDEYLWRKASIGNLNKCMIFLKCEMPVNVSMI